jgi:hypothetical protein
MRTHLPSNSSDMNDPSPVNVNLQFTLLSADCAFGQLIVTIDVSLWRPAVGMCCKKENRIDNRKNTITVKDHVLVEHEYQSTSSVVSHLREESKKSKKKWSKMTGINSSSLPCSNIIFFCFLYIALGWHSSKSPCPTAVLEFKSVSLFSRLHRIRSLHRQSAFSASVFLLPYFTDFASAKSYGFWAFSQFLSSVLHLC